MIPGRDLGLAEWINKCINIAEKQLMTRHVYRKTWCPTSTITISLEIDLLGRPTVPAGSESYFAYVSLHPSVPTFQNITKQTSLEIMIASGGIVGLAVGLIDAICLVCFVFQDFEKWDGRTNVNTGGCKNGRTACEIIVITAGRHCGSAS